MWWPSIDQGGNSFAYSQINPFQEEHLVVQTFDITIYSRGKANYGNNTFMELFRKICCCGCLGSPLLRREMNLSRSTELASIPLDIWSKLATRIKESRSCIFLGQLWVRIFWWAMFWIYIVVFCVVLLPMMIEILFHGIWFPIVDVEQIFYPLFGFVLLLMTSFIVSNHLEQKHIDEVFLPSVRKVLSELDHPLAMSGYEVELLLAENNASTCAPRFFPKESWFLRFTILPNDEERRIAGAAGAARTTPWAARSGCTANTIDPAFLDAESIGV